MPSYLEKILYIWEAHEGCKYSHAIDTKNSVWSSYSTLDSSRNLKLQAVIIMRPEQRRRYCYTEKNNLLVKF